jgi:hypothetical protein
MQLADVPQEQLEIFPIDDFATVLLRRWRLVSTRRAGISIPQ